ncbi:MAG: TldD/PmbA family protein [Candidatus Lokiarchaeota archaeon]|nr:TldD/PmbA family protein [Candidatus Lokiarchaeota archaeon]
MSNEKLNLIESGLKKKGISEYEIYLVDQKLYETIFLKTEPDNERQASSFEYFIRILDQKADETGIGVINGSSLDPMQIEKNIDLCQKLSKMNTSSKYSFPGKVKINNIKTADEKILNDPVGIKKELSDELISEANNQRDVSTTFGRFRIHVNQAYLRNSNGADLNSLSTSIFIEYALKAQKGGKLAEFWDFGYFKEIDHLNLSKRVENWAKIAIDTLIAESPKPNNKAIVIFPPDVLNEAIPPVGFHATGRAHYQKISSTNIGDVVASKNFTMYDNGLLEGGMNTRAWDAEGNARQKTEVISKGVLKNRLYDQKYAFLEKMNSTGNARREDNGVITNGVTNYDISAGDISLDKMISNIDDGYYIKKFSWLNPDPMTGSFGVEIRNGYYIKNGELSTPIKLGNVSGNVLEMIKNCLFISKEQEYTGNARLPYIAFSDLEVSS